MYLTRQAKYARRDTEVRSRHHCCRGKPINIKHYGCVCIFATVIRNAKRMRRIEVSPVACLALTYFLHHVTNGKIVEKQDRQCTYNLTLRCVRETIVAVQKQ